MATLVLTLIGDDRAGLVNAVADVITSHGGNWERSQMAELGGKFAGIVMVTVPDGRRDELVASLEPLQGLLDITVQLAADTVDDRMTRRLELEIMGTDRPGIVHEITEVLTAHAVNIELLDAATRDAPMAGGTIFEATAELEVGETTDLDALRDALEALAHELMVEIELDDSL